MKKSICIFLSVIALFSVLLTSCEKTPVKPDDITTVVTTEATRHESPLTDAPPVTTAVTKAPETEKIPAVTTAPAYDGKLISSGSAKSDTGTKLELVFDWYAYEYTDTQIMLVVNVGADSYSLFSGGGKRLTLTVGDIKKTSSSPEIKKNENTRSITGLCSFEMAVDKTGEKEITAEWNYNGSYSGIALEWITAKTKAVIE